MKMAFALQFVMEFRNLICDGRVKWDVEKHCRLQFMQVLAIEVCQWGGGGGCGVASPGFRNRNSVLHTQVRRGLLERAYPEKHCTQAELLSRKYPLEQIGVCSNGYLL